MTRGRPTDGVRAVAVLVAAVAQIVGSPLGAAVAGRSVGEVSDQARSLITPAGYAFTIWAVVFAGGLAWAVYQALPGQRDRAVHRRTGWPLAAAFAGNAVWEVLFPLVGDSAPLVPAVLLAGIVAAAATGWARLQDLRLSGLPRLLPAAVTGLLLGWVTLASAAQVATAGVALGAPAQGPVAQAWSVFALAAVGTLAAAVVLVARVSGGPFAAAVVWGLVAIAVDGGPTVVTVVAVLAAATVATALGVRAVLVPERGALLIG
jgi:hypothetical protein